MRVAISWFAKFTTPIMKGVEIMDIIYISDYYRYKAMEKEVKRIKKARRKKIAKDILEISIIVAIIALGIVFWYMFIDLAVNTIC